MKINLRASGIGTKAHSLLAKDNNASVAGVTSRGVYLRLSSGWTIYLSTERYRGPLTVNLIGDTNELSVLEPNQVVWLIPSAISFPASAIYLPLDQAEVWQPQSRKGNALTMELVKSRTKDSLHLAIEAARDQELQELIAAYIGGETLGSIRPKQILRALRKISVEWKQHNVHTIAAAAEALFGFGTGLTPWGDDIIMGMLLVLNRWGDRIASDIDLSLLNQTLVRDAWAQTTSLSASLIECAAVGQADERLIAVLDSIFTGESDLRTSTAKALTWGSSSGAAALFGIASLLSS